MKYFALKIAYNGSQFSGFAPQKNEQIRSVSETLQEKLRSLGIDSDIIGAGRTDKGVHALGMVVGISALECWEAERLFALLSPKLYPDIKLRAVCEVDASFHARFSAISRRYYYVFSPDMPSPFLAPFVSWERVGDVETMQKCLQMCVGAHDFALFCKSGGSAKNTTREIYRAHLRVRNKGSKAYYVAMIEGNSFLRAQIRLLMGAILAASRGEISLDDFKAQILAQARAYSQPAGPQGLYFANARYDNVRI